MINKVVVRAAVIGATAVLASSAVAQANPATSMSMIESSAAQLCTAINARPTADGVLAGMTSLQNQGLDEMDGALVLVTAMHHVCPQHQYLVMGAIESFAAEDVCGRSS